MQWPKGCRRCGGDLLLQWDGRWSFVACVSCGSVKVEQGQLALAALRSASPERRPSERAA